MPDKDPRAGRLLSFLHQHRQQWQKAPLPLPFLSVLALLPPSRRHRLLCQAPQKAPQNADLGGIDTLPSPFCRMVHDPEKRSQNTPFPPGNSEILADLGKPSPQTPLYSLCSQTATIQLAGFRNKLDYLSIYKRHVGTSSPRSSRDWNQQIHMADEAEIFHPTKSSDSCNHCPCTAATKGNCGLQIFLRCTASD